MDYASIFKNFSYDSNSKFPFYIQLLNFIRSKIINKELEKLPSERELSSLLNVSRLTINKVYDKLKNEGLIYSKKGSGYYINFDSLAFVQSRKEKAYILINNLIDELLKEDFSFNDIKNFFNSILSYKELNVAEINLAFIDCNIESFFILSKQLRDLYKINLFFYPIEYFYKRNYDNIFKQLKNSFEFIITTKKHYKEIYEKFKGEFENEVNLIKVNIEPDSKTVLKLAKVDKNAKKLVITFSSKFSIIIKDYLKKFDIYKNVDFFPIENYLNKNLSFFESYNFIELEKYINENLKKYDCFIIPEYFNIGNYLRYFKENKNLRINLDENILMKIDYLFKNYSNMIIYFNYKIDNGSLLLIEDKINEIYRKKFKDFIKEGVLNEKD
ncbi:MAG: GntR family transcriptional regulator [Spirochaetes bacterium]|nr:GntR family transcriptional regulator [Spirochaetota bacterium]